MPTPLIFRDGAELYQLYVVDRHSMQYIADKFGVNIATVHRALRRHGIAARRRGPVPGGGRA